MLAAAFAAFLTVFIAEIGDKTQLVSLSMACRYPPLQVLGGAMLALALVFGIGIGAGALIYSAVPHSLLKVLSGAMFIIIGLVSLLNRSGDKVEAACDQNGRGFYQTLLMVFVAEFGDKSQLAVILLVAGMGFPLAVFCGAMLALFINHVLAVYLGARFLSRLNPQYLKYGTAALFFLVGIAVLTLDI